MLSSLDMPVTLEHIYAGERAVVQLSVWKPAGRQGSDVRGCGAGTLHVQGVHQERGGRMKPSG